MAEALKSATITPVSISWLPQLDDYEPSLTKAKQAAAQFVAEVAAGAEPRWLTISGLCGCGKTFLAEQVFLQARQYNPGDPGSAAFWPSNKGSGDWINGLLNRPCCRWLEEPEFARRLLNGEYQLPEIIRDDFLVVLDDLGSSRDKTDFIADALYRVCNARLGKWTVFTTNLTISEVSAKIDERVASRLIRDRNVLVRIEACDYALLRMKQESA